VDDEELDGAAVMS